MLQGFVKFINLMKLIIVGAWDIFRRLVFYQIVISMVLFSIKHTDLYIGTVNLITKCDITLDNVNIDDLVNLCKNIDKIANLLKENQDK